MKTLVHKSAYLAIVAFILLGVLLSACGTQATEEAAPPGEAAPAEEKAAPTEEEEPAAKEEEASKETLVFGVVPKITHPFYDDVLAGLEEATAGVEGVEYQWIAPPTGNPAEQVQILEDLINKGVNGIGLAPLEAASVEPVIAQAVAAGIPVVTFDSDAPDSERTAYYGTDNRAAGRQQAEVMAEALGGKGKVAILTGSLVMANLNERMEGVNEVFAEKYPDIEVVDTIATDDDFAKGLEVSEAMLRAHPDLDGVIAVSMTGSVAMPKVLADPAFADREDLVVVAFDDFEDTLKGIRDGYIQATMVQRPKQMGIYVIDGLTALNTGGTAESIDTGITVVTMDNIDTYKTSAAPAGEEATKGSLVFGVVPKITHPFYDDVLAGLEEATAGVEGVEYQWIAPPTGNPAEQVQILEDLINKGVNGIGLAPLEAASVEPVIAQAVAAGIPVVTFDSDAPDSERTAYYGTDNRAAGRQQAEVMAEALGGKGKVAILTGSLVMANLNERMEGVNEVFAEKYPDIEVVDTIATDDDFAKGLDVSEAMLRAHPDLDGVIAVSMTGSVAMPKVLADPAFADREDLVVVAFDDFEDTLKGIRDGYIQATMVQRPKQMGIYVIDGLTALNTGGTAESVDTGITVVTMDNIDTYKTGAPAEGAALAEELVFGVVPKITHPFYDDVLAGLEEATAGMEGVEYQWIAPPTGNPAEQVQILEDLINKGVNGIGLAPLEAASVEPVIAQAVAAGIPVVTFDSDAPDSERAAYYGTDNRAAGRQQAEVMAEALGGKGKVAILTGSLVMANLNERMEGVNEVFAEKYPEIEVVDTIATDDDFAKGLDVSEAMLRAHPDLDGVIAVSMTGSVAMPKVLADPAFADREDLVVVAFDDFEDTLKGIRDGYIQATMVQRPKQMGIYVIDGLTALNTGGAAESVDTGITVVTMDNIDSYK